jgi:hypothetical protein
MDILQDINNTASACFYELFLQIVHEERFYNMNWQLSQMEFYVWGFCS